MDIANSARLIFGHEWTSFLFRSDHRDRIYLDKCQYETETPWEYSAGECMVEASDLVKILAPDLRITREGQTLRIVFDSYLRHIPEFQKKRARKIIDGCAFWPECESVEAELTFDTTKARIAEGEVELASPPYEKEDKVFLPAVSLLSGIFGAKVERLTLGGTTFWKRKDEPRDYICLSFDPAFHLERDWIERVMDTLAKKDWGNVYRVVWFPEGHRLMPVRLYVPSTYRSDKANKGVLLFHGGSTNENVYYDRSKDQLQFYAEKYGYLLIAISSYGLSTFFGSRIPILQTLDGIDPETADPNNPEGWPQRTLDLRDMANRGAWVELNYVFDHWNIDRTNLFGQGNSAGSNALTFFAIEYPGLLKAIIPGAGWVNPNFADLTKLRNVPIMHLIGSEDHFGVDYIWVMYDIVEDLRLDCKRYIVGGGDHRNAWLSLIPEMFEFYESHLN